LESKGGGVRRPREKNTGAVGGRKRTSATIVMFNAEQSLRAKRVQGLRTRKTPRVGPRVMEKETTTREENLEARRGDVKKAPEKKGRDQAPLTAHGCDEKKGGVGPRRRWC